LGEFRCTPSDSLTGTVQVLIWMFGVQRRRVRRCDCETLLPKLTVRPVTWQRADMSSPLMKIIFDKVAIGL
jgi:hypothetical protein